MGERTKLGQELYELGLRLGSLGAVAIGSGGGPLARTLARAAGCGVALAGGEARFHDGSCAACGAWVGRYYSLPATRFHQRLDVDGPDAAVGEWDLLTGSDCAWAACRVGDRRTPGGLAAAIGPAALTLALERLGYEVADRPIPGAAVFRADPEGLSLTVEQDGVVARPIGEDSLEAAVYYVDQPQAVPAFRPAEDGAERK